MQAMPQCSIRRSLRALVLATMAAPSAWAASPATPPEAATASPETALRLHVQEQGQGAPVLLIHGLGASTFAWRNIAPELAKTHRVLSVDLKGFGRSPKPADGAYAAADQAHLIAALIRGRGLEHVTLIGHSFGGAVAARVALEMQDERKHISQLVLIDAPVLADAVPRSFNFVKKPGVLELMMKPLAAQQMARLLLEGSRLSTPSEADIAGYAAPYEEADARSAFAETARSIVRDRDREIENRLAELRIPSLVIWCRKDDIVPLSAGRRLANALEGSRLAVLSGCRHLPMDETPEALLANLMAFLKN
jgi:pimeloyl-ACP methyl ester carboxylesterase